MFPRRHFFPFIEPNREITDVIPIFSKGKFTQAESFPVTLLTYFITGEKEMASELEELYGEIDAMELYPGLLVEKPRPDAVFGETMVEIGAPFSLKGLMGNAICSPEYWKPSTFGGKVGFDIVNTASLQSLICSNVKGCPATAFHVLNSETAAISNVSTSSAAREELSPALLLKESYAEL